MLNPKPILLDPLTKTKPLLRWHGFTPQIPTQQAAAFLDTIPGGPSSNKDIISVQIFSTYWMLLTPRASALRWAPGSLKIDFVRFVRLALWCVLCTRWNSGFLYTPLFCSSFLFLSPTCVVCVPLLLPPKNLHAKHVTILFSTFFFFPSPQLKESSLEWKLRAVSLTAGRSNTGESPRWAVRVWKKRCLRTAVFNLGRFSKTVCPGDVKGTDVLSIHRAVTCGMADTLHSHAH